MISVIIPTYNRGNVLPSAISSVLRQTHADFELIIVDDGSTDDTQQRVESFKDPRIRYLHKNNSGRSAARNYGAAMASGKYLVFLDSDDEALPRWLELLLGELIRPGVEIACCGAKMEVVRRGRTSSSIALPSLVSSGQEDNRGLFLAGTFCMTRELFTRIGGYDEDLTYSENWELGVRARSACSEAGREIISVKEPLVAVKANRDTPSQDAARKMHSSLEKIISKYGPEWCNSSPNTYSVYQASAGVIAVRAGLVSQARKNFCAALRASPGKPIHWARFLLSLGPRGGAVFWCR